MSNNPPSQQRGLQPTGTSPNSFSATDLGSAGLQNPYHQTYTYPSSAHDQSAFAFPTQPHQYRPQLQTQPLPHHQHHHPSLSQVSPTTSRKRQASELNDPSLSGVLPDSASSNASAFGLPPNLGAGPSELDVGMGASHVQPQLPSPVAKKGRTNTPWTPAEEQRLKTLRDAGSSWSEIAKTFPTRTEGSVKKHWYKDMHYAEFAEDEVSSFSAALLQAIKDYENNKWKVIGQKVGKPAKACEQFAKEQGWKV